MALPFIFGGLSTAPMQGLDDNFAVLGVISTISCAESGTNTLALAPISNRPTVTDYENYVLFSFIAASTNTGSVTAAVGSLPAVPVVKDTATGPVALTGGEIVSGNYVVLAYETAINSFHLNTNYRQTNTGAAPGTVTSNTGTVISAAALTGNGTTQAVLLRAGTAAGDYNDTTDTATAIVAAIPGCRVNTYFRIRMINNTNHVQTLLAGSGVTVSGTATTTNGTTHDFVGVVTATGTPAVTIYG